MWEEWYPGVEFEQQLLEHDLHASVDRMVMYNSILTKSIQFYMQTSRVDKIVQAHIQDFSKGGGGGHNLK